MLYAQLLVYESDGRLTALLRKYQEQGHSRAI